MLCKDIAPWCWVVMDQGAQMQMGVLWGVSQDWGWHLTLLFPLSLW